MYLYAMLRRCPDHPLAKAQRHCVSLSRCAAQDKLAFFKDNIATAEDDFDASQYYYTRPGGGGKVSPVLTFAI